MRTLTFKLEENAHNINYFHRTRVKGFHKCGQLQKMLRFMEEESVEIGKGMATNENKLGV
jgi:hypothetical protein